MFLFVFIIVIIALVIAFPIAIKQVVTAEKVNCPRCGRVMPIPGGSAKCPKCRSRVTRTADGKLIAH